VGLPIANRIGYSVLMTVEQTVGIGALHEARPGRRVLVAPDLAALTGPTTGTVELPLRLFWCPDRTFDLAEPGMLAWMYQTVLREATRPEDLTEFLDATTLATLWPGLFLPRGVRAAWEEQHPVLRATATAAA
jgi:hypothetical protein